MTVAEVARYAQTTERTVRRDLASGLLPSTLQHGRRSIRWRDAKRYRAAHRLEGQLYFTVEEYARKFGWGVRTLRRRIAAGVITPVRISARRLVILHAERDRVFEMHKRRGVR